MAVTSELEQLYREHYRSLVRLASVLVDDVATCEELVQDAFVAVMRQSRAWIDPASAPAYLRSAVLNGARSHLRRRQVRERWLGRTRPADPSPGADTSTLLDAETCTMLDALRRLAPRQREVLTLRFYLDLSELEIAETLGISPGSVKTHAHRGLAALARHVGEDR